jgi:hypothetical protein
LEETIAYKVLDAMRANKPQAIITSINANPLFLPSLGDRFTRHQGASSVPSPQHNPEKLERRIACSA